MAFNSDVFVQFFFFCGVGFVWWLFYWWVWRVKSLIIFIQFLPMSFLFLCLLKYSHWKCNADVLKFSLFVLSHGSDCLYMENLSRTGGCSSIGSIPGRDSLFFCSALLNFLLHFSTKSSPCPTFQDNYHEIIINCLRITDPTFIPQRSYKLVYECVHYLLKLLTSHQ